MSNLDEEIRAKTEAFANDLASLVRRAALEAVASVLAGAGAHAPAPVKAAPAPAAQEGSPAARSGEGGPRACPEGGPRAREAGQGGPRVQGGSREGRRQAPPSAPSAPRPSWPRGSRGSGSTSRATPGQGMEAISKALGTSTSDLTLPVKHSFPCREARPLREGVKRATKYFPS